MYFFLICLLIFFLFKFTILKFQNYIFELSWFFTNYIPMITFYFFNDFIYCKKNIVWNCSIQNDELVNNDIISNYEISATLLDLYILTFLSIITSLIAIYKSYYDKTLHLKAYTKFTHINRFHANNTLKTREEIEEEALEERCCPNKLQRYVCRYTFLSEIIVFVQGVFIIAKCMARLNVEIGILDEGEAHHPLYWISLCISSLYCMLTSFCLEYVCIRISSIGNAKRQRAARDQFSSRRRQRMDMMMLNQDEEDNIRTLGGRREDAFMDNPLQEPLRSSALELPSLSFPRYIWGRGDRPRRVSAFTH